jgi:small subunit ribosomal protein S16
LSVVIRLKRFGKKHKKVYRLVIADSRRAVSGETIEEIGFYDPQSEPIHFEVNKERTEYWLSVGAKPSETVHRLLASQGLVEKNSVQSSNQKKTKKELKQPS